MNMGVWIAIGLTLGIAVGAAMDNVAIGVALGVAFGCDDLTRTTRTNRRLPDKPLIGLGRPSFPDARRCTTLEATGG